MLPGLKINLYYCASVFQLFRQVLVLLIYEHVCLRDKKKFDRMFTLA